MRKTLYGEGPRFGHNSILDMSNQRVWTPCGPLLGRARFPIVGDSHHVMCEG